MPFIIGLALGYAAGILIAPSAGKDTRDRIKERLDANAREKAREIGARAGEKAYEEIKSRI
jgi:gas vesicle protein